MLLTSFVFYLFAGLVLGSALMVISARNPVHSVIFLILSFFNSAGLFVLLGAEFIAMILVIVYVGAVAVLFLFVVMMLDISFSDLRRGAAKFVPLGLTVGLLLLGELILLYLSWPALPAGRASSGLPIPDPAQVENTVALGQVLYTRYMLPFQVSGLILLVAMIGAIVLTMRHREGVRHQSVSDQVARRPEDVMTIEKVKTGAGV